MGGLEDRTGPREVLGWWPQVAEGTDPTEVGIGFAGSGLGGEKLI